MILLNLASCHGLLRNFRTSADLLQQALLALRCGTGALAPANAEAAGAMEHQEKQRRIAEPRPDRTAEAALSTVETTLRREGLLDFGAEADEKEDEVEAREVEVAKKAEGPAASAYDGAVMAATQVLFSVSVLLQTWPGDRDSSGGQLREDSRDKADGIKGEGTFGSDDASSRGADKLVDWEQLVGSIQLKNPLAQKGALRQVTKCVTRLAGSWSWWGLKVFERGSSATTSDSSGVSGQALLLQELIPLCFFNMAAVLSALSDFDLQSWVLPILKEGVALSLVLFGPGHPLSSRLLRAVRKAAYVWRNCELLRIHGPEGHRAGTSPVRIILCRPSQGGCVSTSRQLQPHGRRLRSAVCRNSRQLAGSFRHLPATNANLSCIVLL